MNSSDEWELPPSLPSNSEDRNWAMAAHLAPSVVNLATGGGAGFIVTLVIYLIKKGESEFIAEAAREALNFQITVFFAFLGAMALFFSGIFTCIGMPALFLLPLAALVLNVIAAISVNKGEIYRYPVCLRPIS